MDKELRAKTMMDDFDKQQVDEFMELVHHTLYTIIDIHEKDMKKPFEARDDADMEELCTLAHRSIDITFKTLKALDEKHIEMMKKKFKVIKGD